MNIHCDPNKTTPQGLARYACDFFEAAKTVNENLGAKLGNEIIAPIPALYLSAHSIELCLKSYMVHSGLPLEDIPKRKLSHNLIKCLKKANEMGLKDIISFEQAEVGAIELLSELYSTKQLNYIVAGSKHIPLFSLVQMFCEKLICTVCEHVGCKEYA